MSAAVERGDEQVVGWSGDLDAATTPRLGADLTAVLATAAGRVVLDLKRVRFVDSTGLGALLAAAGHARETGVDLVLRNPPSQLVRIMAMTQTYGEFRWG